MSIVIAPSFSADTVVLDNIGVQYRQAWDGVAWVITPANIEVIGRGVLADNTGQGVTNIDITIGFNDLPAAGQQALQDLHQHVEQALADKIAGV